MFFKYWSMKMIAGLFIGVLLVFTTHTGLAQQDTDPPGSAPYPMATSTIAVRPLDSSPDAYPSPMTTPVRPLDSSPDAYPSPMTTPARPGTASTPLPTVVSEPDTGPTPTLIPLPSLTLDFPAFSPTPTAIPAAAEIGVLSQNHDIVQRIDERVDRQIESIGILIVVIWLLLGAFLILYLKRLGF
jgi:hypothetical protein